MKPVTIKLLSFAILVATSSVTAAVLLRTGDQVPKDDPQPVLIRQEERAPVYECKELTLDQKRYEEPTAKFHRIDGIAGHLSVTGWDLNLRGVEKGKKYRITIEEVE